MSMTWSSASGVQVAQLMLRFQYQDLVRRGIRLADLRDVEFQCHSQNGEDGILLYIFSVLSATNRRVVEISAGDGIECNSANLIVNHGWNGLLFDGDADQVAKGTAFYSACPTTRIAPPKFVNAWITAENVNTLVAQNGFGGPIDLLSLDVDGNDYWIWRALTCATPRVVVLEFNANCGPESCVAMSYKPEYRLDLTAQPYRCGASLPAFVKLARAKGYRLVGVQALGFNAFFVREGLAEELLPEQSPRQCYARNERLKGWAPAWLHDIVSGKEAWEEV
jgi:hypothetical protein